MGHSDDLPEGAVAERMGAALSNRADRILKEQRLKELREAVQVHNMNLSNAQHALRKYEDSLQKEEASGKWTCDWYEVLFNELPKAVRPHVSINNLRDVANAIQHHLNKQQPWQVELEDKGACFNINGYVWVRLTDKGRAVIEEKAYPLGENDQQGEWTRFQFYELMNVFGEHTHMGNPPCFDLNIRIKL